MPRARAVGCWRPRIYKCSASGKMPVKIPSQTLENSQTGQYQEKFRAMGKNGETLLPSSIKEFIYGRSSSSGQNSFFHQSPNSPYLGSLTPTRSWKPPHRHFILSSLTKIPDRSSTRSTKLRHPTVETDRGRKPWHPTPNSLDQTPNSDTLYTPTGVEPHREPG